MQFLVQLLDNSWLSLAGLLLTIESIAAGWPKVPTLEEGYCREVYSKHPLDFPESISSTCFGENNLSVEFGSVHKSGTVFGHRFLRAIQRYCYNVAIEAGEPQHAPQEWECGSGITHLREQEDEGYGVVGLAFCSQFAPEEECTPMKDADRGRAKIVHFIRNPFDLILSAYNYHLRGTESWETDSGHNYDKLFPDVVQPSQHNMTYLEILRGLDMADGIKMEAENMEVPVRRMVSAHCQLRGQDEIYLPVRFSDFLGGDGPTQSCLLLRFLGMREEHASKLTSNLYPFDESGRGKIKLSPNSTSIHTTAGSFDKDTQIQLLARVNSYEQILETEAALNYGICSRCAWCNTGGFAEDDFFGHNIREFRKVPVPCAD
ncbi:unnamed protein product [Choristocarpus tenellus]